MSVCINSFVGQHRFLSNFYPAVVMLDGWEYPTIEHAFQAAKTNNPVERARIRSALTPGDAKRLGRQVKLIPNWDEKRLGVMAKLLAEKFKDPELRAKLLQTGTATLVEGNTWNDQFWGVCRGKGENHLGRLLMELRDSIRAESGEAR